jgi:hypothetical protein
MLLRRAARRLVILRPSLVILRPSLVILNPSLVILNEVKDLGPSVMTSEGRRMTTRREGTVRTLRRTA